MARRRTRKRRSKRRPYLLQKPRGIIHPRVQKVGPEHFGIVSVDCAKLRSKWLLADFYGNVIVSPTTTEHNRHAFDATMAAVKEATAQHELRDILVAVERTGQYHLPIKRAFSRAGFDTRVVHPLTSKKFRTVDHPDIKTDDNDLAAIHRASVNGFALAETPRAESWVDLLLLIRHRRDWVGKNTALQCQIKEHLHAAMPGYATCFRNLWDHRAALELALHFGSPEAIRQAGAKQMAQHLREVEIRFQYRTIQRVLLWAQQTAGCGPGRTGHRQIARALNEDRLQKEQQIQALERRIAAGLVRTPYVLLVSIPGINVVSAAEFAGEAGPIEDYATGRCITGRAGLYPTRYQSDRVDRPDGPLAKCANRRLRFALMQVADNLVLCNTYFRNMAAAWQSQRVDPRLIRVRVAQRFARIAFQMVSGRSVFRHPCAQQRHHILRKLVTFYNEHKTPPAQTLDDLQAASQQIPGSEHAAEARPLEAMLGSLPRRRAPQPLGEILSLLLAKLRPRCVEYNQSGTVAPPDLQAVAAENV